MRREVPVFTYDNEGNLVKQSDGTNTLEFIYDGNGLCGVKCNNENYLYRKNAQGDITHILDNTGMVVAKYIYDAWGNHAIVDANGNDLASGVGVLNPFRYRSYYYDEETNLYYLQTRYYDPELGRFLSQDDVSYLAPDSSNGLNLYAYCANNPVMNVDPTGTIAFWIIAVIILGVAMVIGGTIGGVCSSQAGNSPLQVFKDIMIGIGIGLMVAGGLLALIGAAMFLIVPTSIAVTLFALGAVGFNVGSIVFSAFSGEEGPGPIEAPKVPEIIPMPPTTGGMNYKKVKSIVSIKCIYVSNNQVNREFLHKAMANILK